MAISKITIEQFLVLSKEYLVFDVRSPAEYQHAHIPGALSLPLFTNDERAIVGTAYKQQSRQTAIKIGLDFFAPKMRKMVEEVEALSNTQKGNNDKFSPTIAGSNNDNNFPPTPIGGEIIITKSILLHCWRGGMRSAAIAWLLDLYGYKVYTLTGGYKSYRETVYKKIPN